jgi:acetyl esterase/lipase
VQPERSRANLDALARVEVRRHTLPEAPGVEIPHGVYGYLVATPLGFNERGWYGSRAPGNNATGRAADPGPENLGELSGRDVMAVLGLMRRDFNADPDRTYLIGQSMGGGGTWHIGMKYPDVWAALATMAPAIYSSPDVLVGVRDRLPPIMVIHGDADETVDVEISRRWVARLRELGVEHTYLEVPGGSTRAPDASTSRACSSS